MVEFPIRVKLTTGSPDWPWLRQTPGESGIWGSCLFLLECDVEECDYWIVYGKLMKSESTKCPKGNILFYAPEPSTIRSYDQRFLKQFDTVITCQRDMVHPSKLYRHQAINWFAGVRFDSQSGKWLKTLNYEQLKVMVDIPKTKELSVICSAKVDTQGHLDRKAFVEALISEFGNNIDVFGFGYKPVADKWETISPYRYHIVLENSSFPDYWTEKLADSYLGLSYPLYYGCKNLTDYFTERSFTRIDIHRPYWSIARIREAIMDQRYEKNLDALKQARKLVLDRYNLFAEIERYCLENRSEKLPLKVTLHPESIITRPWYWPLRSLERVLRKNWRQWLGRGRSRV